MFNGALALPVAVLVLSMSLSLAQSAAAATRDVFVNAAPNVRIHVLVTGPASSKHPLVLIPGWRLTAAIWKQQMVSFSRDRQVIVVDPRSQGYSTKTSEGDTPEQRARDLDAVLKQLKVGSIVLVGWSQGVQDVADLFGVDRSGALARFDRPTVVIASGASQELDAQKAMASTLPQGRIEVMEDAGHAVFADQPEHFDRLLEAFLAQIER